MCLLLPPVSTVCHQFKYSKDLKVPVKQKLKRLYVKQRDIFVAQLHNGFKSRPGDLIGSLKVAKQHGRGHHHQQGTSYLYHCSKCSCCPCFHFWDPPLPRLCFKASVMCIYFELRLVCIPPIISSFLHLSSCLLH